MQYDKRGNILVESLIFLLVMICMIQVVSMMSQVHFKLNQSLERDSFYNEEIQALYFANS